jgi:hypothetical protein
MHKTLIIRGVDSTDELSSLGMPVALKYSECDRVVLISKRGQPRVVKGSERDASLTDLQFVDADQSMSDFLLCIQKIKTIFEDAHPETVKLSHAFVGQWLFYWMNENGYNNLQLLREGRIDEVMKLADEFIERDFGMSAEKVRRNDGHKISHQTSS